ADGVRRQAVTGEPGPGGTTVGALPDCAAGATALAAPGVDHQLPGRGEQRVRVGRMHDDVDRAGVLVDEEHLLPGLTAVFGAEDPAIRLGPVAVALRRDVHDVGIGWVDREASDPPRGLEAHLRPGAAGIGALVDPVADRDVAPDPGLTRPGPYDARI